MQDFAVLAGQLDESAPGLLPRVWHVLVGVFGLERALPPVGGCQGGLLILLRFGYCLVAFSARSGVARGHGFPALKLALNRN